MRTTPYFDVCGYKVITERLHEPVPRSQAIVEISIGGECVRRSSLGCGPVHALDNALRSCLGAQFAELENVRLSDYTVTVVDATDGTGAEVRVVVEATDELQTWRASCISENIIDASFEALCEAAVVHIARLREIQPLASATISA
jgi:2-isopropylmalate synthase